MHRFLQELGIVLYLTICATLFELGILTPVDNPAHAAAAVEVRGDATAPPRAPRSLSSHPGAKKRAFKRRIRKIRDPRPKIPEVLL